MSVDEFDDEEVREPEITFEELVAKTYRLKDVRVVADPTSSYRVLLMIDPYEANHGMTASIVVDDDLIDTIMEKGFFGRIAKKTTMLDEQDRGGYEYHPSDKLPRFVIAADIPRGPNTSVFPAIVREIIDLRLEIAEIESKSPTRTPPNIQSNLRNVLRVTGHSQDFTAAVRHGRVFVYRTHLGERIILKALS